MTKWQPEDKSLGRDQGPQMVQEEFTGPDKMIARGSQADVGFRIRPEGLTKYYFKDATGLQWPILSASVTKPKWDRPSLGIIFSAYASIPFIVHTPY